MLKNAKKNILRELRCVNTAGIIVGAIILAVIRVILWCVVGTPLGVYYFLRGKAPIPPCWLYMLIDLVVQALLGASAGMVLCDRRYYCETQKYRGAFYFLLAITVGSLFYAFFFGAAYFLVAILLAVMETFALVICCLNFCHVIRLSAVPVALGCFWAVYCLILSLIAFFVV